VTALRRAPHAAIVVVGSLNMDLVVTVPRLPGPGETITGGPLSASPGGKGANQAVAAARFVGHRGVVRMVGAVGADDHGGRLRRDLVSELVSARLVRQDPERPTGTAVVIVDAEGENSIVVSEGANASWPEAWYDDVPLTPADVVVCQLEIPLTAAHQAVQHGRAHGSRTILNAAPARTLPPEVLADVDVLVVNESEARVVLDRTVRRPTDLAGCDLPCAVVVTLGARGALVKEVGGDVLHLLAPPVPVVSTVGAGDAFVGALAAWLLMGADLRTASRHAVAAGALAVTCDGTRGAALTAHAVRRLTDQVRPARPAAETS
jgi:ribokinase